MSRKTYYLIGIGMAALIFGAFKKNRSDLKDLKARTDDLIERSKSPEFERMMQDDKETLNNIKKYLDERLDEARDNYMKAETEDGPE